MASALETQVADWSHAQTVAEPRGLRQMPRRWTCCKSNDEEGLVIQARTLQERTWYRYCANSHLPANCCLEVSSYSNDGEAVPKHSAALCSAHLGKRAIYRFNYGFDAILIDSTKDSMKLTMKMMTRDRKARVVIIISLRGELKPGSRRVSNWGNRSA